MTAAVHLANNVFKGFLLGKRADRDVLLRFGIPAVAAALLGALLLGRLSGAAPLFEYEAFGRTFTTTALGIVVGVLILLLRRHRIVATIGDRRAGSRNGFRWAASSAASSAGSRAIRGRSGACSC